MDRDKDETAMERKHAQNMRFLEGDSAIHINKWAALLVIVCQRNVEIRIVFHFFLLQT